MGFFYDTPAWETMNFGFFFYSSYLSGKTIKDDSDSEGPDYDSVAVFFNFTSFPLATTFQSINPCPILHGIFFYHSKKKGIFYTSPDGEKST